MELMKDRLAHILRSKNLTASQFAEMMQIQPSNVSHLLSGRNKPSMDFLIRLKELFPEYSFDWIILGKRPITVSEHFTFRSEPAVSNDLKDTDNVAVGSSNPLVTPELFNADIITSEPSKEDKTLDEEHVRPHRHFSGPVKMIFIYEDDSFEIFNLRKK